MCIRETSKECLWTFLSLVENACTKNVSCAENNKVFLCRKLSLSTGRFTCYWNLSLNKERSACKWELPLDRRQGLYRETQFERMRRFVIHPCKTEHAHEEIPKTSTHIHKHTAQKHAHAQERNLLPPWNAVWCNIVSVSSAYDSVREWCAV